MNTLAILPILFAFVFAHPSPIHNFLQDRSPDFEWTAWGDSYASGVGAGDYVDGRRCLRYNGAYPVAISVDTENLLATQGGGKFNNVVCSGAKAEDVEKYQFYTEDQEASAPDWQYYPRPDSGKPTMGTLTIGGDDIDFPGILNSCIMEGFPFPMSVGFEDRTCDEQRALSWSLISQDGDHAAPNTELVAKFDTLIKNIVAFGRNASGDSFRLYVTSYAEFFNDTDPGCDNVTFARTANPIDDGEPHIMLTTALRQDFNAMSRTLSLAIKNAVAMNAETNVKYIDIDSMLWGHRFCESGIQEPDQNNPNLWFYHYPYNQDDQVEKDPAIGHLKSVVNRKAMSISFDPSKTLWADHINAVWSTIDEEDIVDATSLYVQKYPARNTSERYDIWGDSLGWRGRVFHPTTTFHKAIYEAIISQYKNDTGA